MPSVVRTELAVQRLTYRVHKHEARRSTTPIRAKSARLGDPGTSRASQAAVAESDVRLINVTPFPIARLERLHHRMSGLLKVFVGVLTGRGIAAADVSAVQTFAQLHPTLTSFETFFTTLAAGRDICIGLLYVLTLRHEASLKKISFLDEPARGSDSRNPECRVATVNRCGSATAY